jgi:hypothetical protein
MWPPIFGVEKLGVEKDDFGIGSPGPAEPHVGRPGSRGQGRVVEDEAAVLAGRVLGLGGEKTFGGGRAVNLAGVKDGPAVAEDEVQVAFDVAVGKVLARGRAGKPRAFSSLPAAAPTPATAARRLRTARSSSVRASATPTRLFRRRCFSGLMATGVISTGGWPSWLPNAVFDIVWVWGI